MMEAEAQASPLTGKSERMRCFLSGGGRVGWATLVSGRKFADILAEPETSIAQRVLKSAAVQACCFLTLPCDESRLRAKTGHDLCPAQRTVRFTEGLLGAFGFATRPMLDGVTPFDFHITEFESDTGAMARIFVTAALKRAAGPDQHIRESAVEILLSTEVRRRTEMRSSLIFRQSLLAVESERVKELARRFCGRGLKRAKTDTEERVAAVVAMLPAAPSLPQGLHKAPPEVAHGMALCTLHVTEDGLCVGDSLNVAKRLPEAQATFWNEGATGARAGQSLSRRGSHRCAFVPHPW